MNRATGEHFALLHGFVSASGILLFVFCGHKQVLATLPPCWAHSNIGGGIREEKPVQ
jgi:hypothetical protein